MPLYAVTARNPYASYGPQYIEAEDEYQAIRLAGRRDGDGLSYSARLVSAAEVKRALEQRDHNT